ncbi:MAG: hemerythrin domain-containing protein [Lachnospirales bacterium]
MKSIDLMKNEHQLIFKAVDIIKKESIDILEGKEINTDLFYNFIEFVRKFADEHHHGKEEKFLFKEMQDKLGEIGVNVIKHGMLVEHDLGRLYMAELETSLNDYKANNNSEIKLDILTNTMSYAKLISRHMAKEDDLIYVFGMKNLPEDVMAEVDKKSLSYEKEHSHVRDYYEKLIENKFKK